MADRACQDGGTDYLPPDVLMAWAITMPIIVSRTSPRMVLMSIVPTPSWTG